MADSIPESGKPEYSKSPQVKKDSRQQTGKLGEEMACSYLLQNGYLIKERNWRCRSGEIDIIAELEGRLIFIEVRARRQGGRFGSAAESVDRRKQQQVRSTAQVYMHNKGIGGAPIRFDVIAIVFMPDDTIHECKHYEAAF